MNHSGSISDGRKKVPLPADLIDAFVRGDVVLFCGGGLSSLAGLPTARDTARVLALRLTDYDGYKHDLAEVAAMYEASRGRHSLISFVKNLMQSVSPRPTRTHLDVVSLGAVAIVTTNWDTLLEASFELAGAPFATIVADSQLPFLNLGSRPLIKIHGSLEQPESIVITDRDHYSLFHTRPGIIGLLGSYFTSRTILFLGFELLDPEFRRLFYDCQERFGSLARRTYAVQLGVPSADVRRWEKQNLKIIDGDIVSTIKLLTLSVKR